MWWFFVFVCGSVCICSKGLDERQISHSDVLCSASTTNEDTSSAVTMEDLHHLWQLVEVKDGGPPWIQMMDRSTPNMNYQAWRREPKVASLGLL